MRTTGFLPLVLLAFTACQSLEERIAELEQRHRAAEPGTSEQLDLAYQLLEAYDEGVAVEAVALDKLGALGESAPEDLDGADLLVELAEVYASHATTKEELTEARALAARGLELYESPERPAELDEDDWAIRRDWGLAVALKTRGIIDVKLGHIEDGRAALEQSLAMREDPSARVYLGRAHQLSGQPAEAARHYAAASLQEGDQAELALAEKALASLAEDGIDLGQTREGARNELKGRVSDELIDEPLPELEALGELVTPAALAEGITVIDFWASWCEPCKVEFPILQSFHETHGSAPDVNLVTVSLDENLTDAEDFLEDGGFTLPMAWDGEGALGEAFGVKGLPTLVVVSDGRVRFRVIGLDPALAVTLPARVEILRAAD